MITHADTGYWLGIAERGDMRIFKTGLARLDEAELYAFSLDNDDLRRELMEKIRGSRSDLIQQMDMAHDTLYGVFPLLRFLIRDVARYEMLDDPRVVATTKAATALANRVLEPWRSKPQLHVVYNSHVRHDGDYNPVEGDTGHTAKDLQNEMAYVFNLHPKYFNHNEFEIRSVLTASEADTFYADGLSAELADKLCEAFGITSILQATIREVDVVDQDWFFVAEARLFEKGQGMADARLFVFGFARDLRAVLPYAIGAMGLVLLLPFALLAFFNGELKDKGLLAGVGTAIGIVTSWAAPVAASRWLPDAEMLAVQSFWAILLVALTIYAVPLALASGAHTLIVSRLRLYEWNRRSLQQLFFVAVACGASLLPVWSICSYLPPGQAILAAAAWILPAIAAALFLAESRIGALRSLHPGPLLPVLVGMLPVVLAIIAFMTIPADDMTPPTIVLLAVPLVLGLALTALVAWRREIITGNSFWAFSGAVCFAVLAPLAGMTIQPVMQWALLCFGIAAVGELVRLSAKTIAASGKTTPQVSQDQCFSAWIHDGEVRTRFVSSDTFSELKAKVLAAVRNHRGLKLRLAGQSGVGKTRTAQELIAAVSTERGEAIILHAVCKETHDAKPYAPFREAFSGFSEAGNTDFYGLVSEMTSAFAGLFLPSLASSVSADMAEGSALSPRAMAVQYVDALRELSRGGRSRPVVLYFDDIEKMDRLSQEMFMEISRGEKLLNDCGILLICCESLGQRCTEGSWEGWDNWMLQGLSEPAEFLITAVGMEAETASLFSRMIQDQIQSTPLVLQDIVRCNKNKLTVQNGRLMLRKDVKEERLEFPAHVADMVRTKIAELPHDVVLIMQLATCFGRRFDVSEVAEIEVISVTVLLERLELAEKAGLVRDVLEEDDIWEFTSGIYHQFLLEELTHPDDKRTPRQRQASYHKIITDMFLGRIKNSKNINRTANDNDVIRATEHAIRSGNKYIEHVSRLAEPAIRRYTALGNHHAAYRLSLNVLDILQAANVAEPKLEYCLLRLAAEQAVVVLPDRETWLGLEQRALSCIRNNTRRGFVLDDASHFASLVCKTILLQLDFARRERNDEILSSRLLDDARDLLGMLKEQFDHLPQPRKIEYLRLQAVLSRRLQQGDAVEFANRAVAIAESILSADTLPEMDRDMLSEASKAYNDRAESVMWAPDHAQRATVLEDFKKSIALKERIQDKAGLARSWGGIGRFHLFGDKTVFDLQSALDAFNKDMQLSREISDIMGLVSMPCFMGHALLRGYAMDTRDLDLVRQARAYYQKCSIAAKKYDDQFNWSLARVGLMICAVLDPGPEEPMQDPGPDLDKAVGILRQIPDIPRLSALSDRLSYLSSTA